MAVVRKRASRLGAAGFLAVLAVAAAESAAGARVLTGQEQAWAEAAPNASVEGPPDVIADCEARLRQAGVEFAAAELPVVPAHGKQPTCGVEQALVYQRGPEGIRYNSAPLVSCGVALGLVRLERVLNEESQRFFGQKVARIEQGGTYNCRKMARFNLVSEHSYANAIDLRGVTLKNGRRLTVRSHFGALVGEPTRPEARFLRQVAHRLYDEDVFSVVLTPFFDALHRDHFHLDQARYRLDGTRP
jgi:hypothetical protein